MLEWNSVVLVPAIGFAAAGLVCAILRLVTAHESGFGMLRSLPGGFVPGFVVSMFAGPYLVVLDAANRWRDGRLTRPMAAITPVLALIWSFCSGVFVIETLILIGLVTA